jgi:pimeloyl-ACP methyl ester carboxylesterase
MTLPGFGFGDAAMLPLRQRLRRQGFETFKWALGVNRGNVPQLIPRVCERVLTKAEQIGEPLALVGWSLGGYIAREVAREHPSAVSRVVTLASPIRGGPKYTAVAPLYRIRGFDLDAIEQAINTRDATPLSVPVSCLYSRNDGVVDWRAVIDPDNPRARNIEVDCSHMAMGFDPDVLDTVVAELCRDER